MQERRGAVPAQSARPGGRRQSGVVALGGFLLVNSGRFQRTLEEVTLPLQHEDIIRQQAAEKDVPPDLIAAVIYTESRFRDQTSHAGARGLMQITPSTAQLIERLSGGQTFNFDDLSNPDINIRYGTFLPPLPDPEVRGQRDRGLGRLQRG